MQPSPQTLAEHAAFVRSLARVLVADPHGADDVAQETWLAALERPPRHGAHPRAWLARLVERLAWRRGRSASRSARREREVARPERLEGPDEGLARAEILGRVTDAVLALEEPYRSTVLLRYYEGLEASEIARRTGAPVATVRSRLQRAHAQLRERLDREHGGERRTWCHGLVGLLAANRLGEIGTGAPVGGASASAAGAATGALAMTTMTSAVAKTAAAVSAVTILGILGWRVLDARPRPAEPADGGTTASALDAPRDTGSTSAPATPSVASEPAPRLALESAAASTSSAAGALAVRVRWARSDRPAESEALRLFAMHHAAGNRVLPGLTDAEGRARFEGIAPGHVLIGSSHGADGSAEIRAGETTSVELAIPLGFTARGRVVDADGAPVAGARLWLSRHYNPWTGAVVGTSGPDGSFALADVPPARYLGAIADGYAPSHLHYLPDLQPQDAQSDVELELRLNGSGGALDIRVTSSDGAPVSGALVQGQGPYPETLRLGNRYLTDIPTFADWSDESGNVAFDGLPPGLAEITACAAGMGVVKGGWTIEAGATASVSIVLRPEGVVAGTVLREDGTPAVGASVLLQGEHGRPDSLQPSAIADSAGNYELRSLPLGELTLRAEAEGEGSASANVLVEPEVRATWDARLAMGRVMHGRVIDDAGAPLSGWSVTARNRMGENPWGASVATDGDGAFRLVDVPRESIVVRVYRDLEREPIATLTRWIGENEDELLLRVEPSARCDAGFVGRFLDARGAPIGSARVTLWAPGALMGPSVESDASGVFRAERLRPGTYDLTADFPAAPSLFLGRFELSPQEVLDLGTIVLGEPGRVRILVNGRAASDDEAFNGFAFQQLDADGNARWAAYVDRDKAGEPVPLHAGRYRFQASAHLGTANEQAWLEVRPGEESRIDLTPRAGRQAMVGGELAAGSSFPERVHTIVRDVAGEVVQECITCEPFGRRYPHLLQLVPGTYELEAEASDGRRALGSFEVDLADAEPLEFYLLLR